MVANSLPEIYTLVYGWFIFEKVWDVIVSTGLFWVPFIIVLIKTSVEARNAGSYAGNVGLLTLQRVETQIVAMLFVIFFACVPFKSSGFNLSVNSVNYEKNINECRQNPDLRIPDKIENAFSDIDGEMVYMPVLWGAIHSLSSAFVNAITVALPCKDDISFSMFQLSESHIQDQLLRDDIQHFHDACYKEAKIRLDRADIIPEPNDTDWLGSFFFMDTTGYYDSIPIGPLEGWTEDQQFSNYSDPGLIYRSCRDFWMDSVQGLEKKVLDQVDSEVSDTFMNSIYTFFTTEKHQTGKRRALAKTIMSVSYVSDLGDAYTDSSKYSVFSNSERAWYTKPIADAVDSQVAALGMAGRSVLLTLKNVGSHTEKFIYRESANYILAIVQMVLIITIPIILLLSGFSLKALAMCGVGYFAVKFINFIWAFAFWLETTWMVAMSADSGWDVNQQLLLNIISNTVYVGLPIAWLVLLGWSGFTINGLIDKLNSDSQKTASSIGSGAAQMANPATYVSGGKAAMISGATQGAEGLKSGAGSSEPPPSRPKYY